LSSVMRIPLKYDSVG